MKPCKILLILLTLFIAIPAAVKADDFNWTRDFNNQAKADSLEFKTRFATRFDLTELQVVALLNIFDTPADAYIMLRFGEMQGILKELSKEQGIAAIKKYRNNKSKGWDAVAGMLGINSESKEFHALKRGHDLSNKNSNSQVLYSAVYESSKINYAGNDQD